MKQKLLNSLRLRLCLLVAALLCVGGKAWGEETVFYTLDGTITGGSNAYADASDITQNSYTWKVEGNTTTNPWRIGGKSLSNTNRLVYSGTAMGSTINKVNLTVGTASNITVNSLKLVVASDADFNDQTDEVTATFKASSTITFQPTSGTEWATGSYYKFIFNVTVSGNSNRFIEFKKAEFYSSAEDERTPVNITSFTASSTTLIKGSTTTTTVTNDQPNWTAAYTFSSNKNSVATVNENGVITAVGKGTATITATLNIPADDENYKVGETSSKTIDITVNNPTHTASFSVNGTVTSTDNVEEGEAITFPANPTDIEGKTFVGWIEEAIDGTTETVPTFINSATMGESDATYYAVFATKAEGNYNEVTDELTGASINAGSSYADWQNKSFTSSAVYAGNSMTGSNSSIQLRAKDNSGIITTTSGGKIGKVNITWNNNTSNGRYLYIYGSNTAYTATSDLYDSSKRGTNIGQLNYSSSDNTTTELIVSGDYQYIGILANGGALYLSSISITWVSGTPDTYSAYCTTVVADTRQEAGISFAESAYTAELMGEFTSPVLTNPNNLTVVWSSSDETVATVNENGVVTIIAEGETVINAAFEGNDDYKPANANYTLTVQDSRAESNPTFATENVTVEIGATVAAPTLTKAGDGAVTYSTSNAAIAAVDATTGNVTGIAEGTATITATVAETNNHKAGSATFTVIVTKPVVSEVKVTDETPYEESFATDFGSFQSDNDDIWTHDTYNDNAYAKATSYINKTNTEGDAWLISPTIDLTEVAQAELEFTQAINKFFGTINEEAMLCIKEVGGDWVQQSITYPSIGTSSYSSFEAQTIDISNYAGKKIIVGFHYIGHSTGAGTWEVNNFKVSGSSTAALKDAALVFTPSNITIAEGATATAEFTKSTTANVTFTNSNENIASYDAATGIVTALAAGTTTITASSAANDEYKAGTATLVVVVNGTPSENEFVLVTDASSLSTGDQIVIAHVDAQGLVSEAMGTTQNDNNRASVEVTYNENDKTITPNANTQIITLEGTAGAWYFNVGNGYLCAASSSKNYLRTQEDKDNNAKASITIDTDGDATITFQGSYTRNIIKFNSSNTPSIFSCYASGQQSVQIYRKANTTPSETVPVSVGATGFATFSCDKALDFTNVETIYAYTATVSGKDISFTRVYQVPANTGLLLRNPQAEAAAEASVPVIASADDIENNALVAVNEEIAELASDGEDGSKNYILNKPNGKNVGFFLAANKKVGAGKAYLNVPAGASVKSFAEIFGSETDGVNEMTNDELEMTNIYNLAGQRLQKLQRGVNIVGGKKVVVK